MQKRRDKTGQWKSWERDHDIVIILALLHFRMSPNFLQAGALVAHILRDTHGVSFIPFSNPCGRSQNTFLHRFFLLLFSSSRDKLHTGNVPAQSALVRAPSPRNEVYTRKCPSVLHDFGSAEDQHLLHAAAAHAVSMQGFTIMCCLIRCCKHCISMAVDFILLVSRSQTLT